MRRSRSPLTIQTMLIRGALVASLASCGGKSSETVVMDDDDGGTGGSGAAQDSSGGASESGGGDGTGGRASSGGGNGSGATSADGGTSTGGVEGTGATGAAGGRDATGGQGATGGEDGTGGRDATGGEGGAPDDSNPGVQTLGDECDAPGTLACAGEGQKLQLLCDGDSWVQNGTCAGAAVCDTSEPNRGSCQEVPEGCMGMTAEDTYCDDYDVRKCGPDRLGQELVEECEGLCEEGQCTFGNQCPDTIFDFYDCAGDCETWGEECSVSAGEECGYFEISADAKLPLVVRTPSATDACQPYDDTCSERGFSVKFRGASNRAYRIRLPEGVEGGVVELPNFDVVLRHTPCYVKENSSTSTGCLTVPSASDSYTRWAIIYVPEGSGPLNLTVEEGSCSSM